MANSIIETCDKWTGAPRLLAITPVGVIVADLWLGEVSLRAGKIDRDGQIDYAEGNEPFTYRPAPSLGALADSLLASALRHWSAYLDAKREWDGFEPSGEEIASDEIPVNGLYPRATDIKEKMEQAEAAYEETKRTFLVLMNKRDAA